MNAYVKRVMEVEEERRRGGKDAPSLRISPGKISPSEVKNLLPGKRNMGLIFGAESIYFQDTVQAVQVEKMYSGANSVRKFSSNRMNSARAGSDRVNVLGVRMDWLCSGGKAVRALIVDETGLVKDVSFEEPVELHVVQILHLPRDSEQELHRKVSLGFEEEGIEVLNPYISSSRADDKNLTHELWLGYRGKTSLDFPAHCLIPSSYGIRRIAGKVKSFIGKLKTGGDSGVFSIVVQPNKGTEGNKVKCFSLNLDGIRSVAEIHPLVTYITEFIHPEDDAILREERGNVKFFRRDGKGFRNITFRMNVVCSGEDFIATSGYAQVSPSESEFVASRTQGGEIISLSEAFMNIYCCKEKKWVRFIPLQDEIDGVKRAAARALEALNFGLSERDYLKSAGVDMVLEVAANPAPYALSPVLLEINPRPAGLAFSLPIPDTF